MKRIKSCLLPILLAALTACQNSIASPADSDSLAAESFLEDTTASDTSASAEHDTEKSAAVTGAPEFTVQRPADNGKTQSAAGYLSETNTGAENAAGMEKLLDDILFHNFTSREKITKLDIPTGTYRFGGEKKDRILLSGLSDLIIEGNGSVFLFEEHEKRVQGSLIRMEECRTLELRNLTVDWDWEEYPLFVIGEVVSADTARNSVRFRIDSHTLPEDMVFHLTFGLGRTWNPEIDNRSETVGFIQRSTPKSVTRLNEHEIEVVYSNDKSARNAKAGQQFQFYFQPNHNASGFRLQSNTNITFENVTIHSAPYEAMNALDSEYMQLLSCKIVPGEGRRFSTYGGRDGRAGISEPPSTT